MSRIKIPMLVFSEIDLGVDVKKYAIAGACSAFVISGVYCMYKRRECENQWFKIHRFLAGFSPEDFIQAACRDDVEMLDRIRQYGGVDVNCRDSKGYTALMCAAECKQLKAMRHLVAQGADVNLTSRNGYTALMHAVKSGATESIQCLIELGARVNEVCPNDLSTALIHAELRNDVRAMRTLLENGADPHMRLTDGSTPLTVSITKNCYKATQLLVAYEVNVNTRANDGSTPLLTATKVKNLATIRMLVDRGACVNARMFNGDSALLIACFEGCTDIVNYLLEVGADIKVQNSHGYTPIQLAELHERNHELQYALKSRGATKDLAVLAKFLDYFKRYIHQRC